MIDMRFRRYLSHFCTINIVILPCVEPQIENNIQIIDVEDIIFNITEIICQDCLKYPVGGNILIGDWGKDNSKIIKSIYNFDVAINLFDIHNNTILKQRKRFKHVYLMNESYLRRRNFPSTNMVMVFSTNLNLTSVLEDFRDSIWWKNEARLIMVNNNLNSSCHFAYTLLNTAWSFKMLNAIYLCRHTDKQLKFYTYNPYAHVATKFWKLSEDSYPLNKHWTLFDRLFFDTDRSFLFNRTAFCEALFFDKTTNFNGFNLRTVTTFDLMSSIFDRSKTGYKRFIDVNYDIFGIVLRYINATVTVKLSKIGYMDENGIPQLSNKDVITGASDYQSYLSLMRDYWKIQTYPYQTSGIRIVSLKRSITYSNRFLKIFSLNVWIVLIIVSFISIFILERLLDLTYYDAVLEYLRIFANVSSPKQPRSLYKCTFFIILKFIILGANSYFQSRLNALATVPDQQPLINSAEDLVRMNLTIQSHRSYRNWMPYNVLRKRFIVQGDFYGCINQVLKGKPVVCLMYKEGMTLGSRSNPQLHVARKDLLERSASFMLPEDSPLRQKINWIMSRLYTGGMVNFWYSIRHELRGNYTHLDEALGKEDTVSGVVGIRFLITGWILASCVIIIETQMKRIERLFRKCKSMFWRKYFEWSRK